MPKKISYIFVHVILIFQLIFPTVGHSSAYSFHTPLKLPLDNWSLGMFGVTIHDHIFVSVPDRLLKLSFVDMEVVGIAFPLRIEHIYTGRSHPKGLLGNEWMLSLESWLEQSSNNSITIISATRNTVFTRGEQGIFTDDSGAELTINTDQTILATYINGHSALYSKSGFPLRVEEPNGNSLNYQYNGSNLTAIEESSGRKLLFFYNTDNLLEEVSDDTGRTVVFHYDSKGRLAKVNRFSVQATTIRYDNNSRLSSIELPSGLELSMAYESKASQQIRTITSNWNDHFLFETLKGSTDIKVSDRSGNTYYYSFYSSGENTIIGISSDLGWLTGYRLDKNGRLAGWQRPDGSLVGYDYDMRGRLVKASGSGGSIIENKYKGNTNQLAQVVNSEGGETSLEYDENLNVTSIAPPGQVDTDFIRHPNGIVWKVNQGDKLVSTTSVDIHGNPVKVLSQVTGLSEFSYDLLGRVVGEQSGTGEKYAYRYNDFDQITHLFRDRDLLVEYSYDSAGNITTARNARGEKFKYTYNPDGTLREIKTPGEKVFSLQRAVNGYQLERIFPNNASKRYSFNHAGMLTQTTDPFGKSKQIKWTPSLNLDRVINEDGSFTRYKYSGGGRLIEKRFSTGESHLFHYSGGRLVSMKSPQFHQEFQYNKQGLLSATEDKILGLTMRWAYDPFGRLSSVSAGDLGKIEYQYDQAGRIKSILDPSLQKTRYSYDASGRISKIQYPNGVSQKYAYDNNINAASSIQVTSGSSVLFDETYLYNKGGMLKETRNGVDGSGKLYTYGPDGELISYTRTSKESAPEKWLYAYDGNGNMIEDRGPKGRVKSEYAGIGQIVKHGQGKMRHDASGNLTTAVFDGKKYNLEYDYSGKLGKVELPDGSIKEYRYDPLGRLIYYVKDGEERHVLWNGNSRLLELDGKKKLVKFYVNGAGLDDVLSVTVKEKLYYHQDRLGSVRLVTDKHGKAIFSYDYAPFGEPLFNKSEYAPHGLVFAGRPYDGDIECYYVRARFYCPSLKRFLSRDPREGIPMLPNSWHPYLYALNNPVNFKDPEGEVFAVIGGVIVYGLATVGSFAAGYFAGSVANEVYHEGKQIIKEGPSKYVKKAIHNKIDAAGQFADKGLSMGLHSYSATKDGDEDEQEAVQTRIGNTKKFVEDVAPMNRFEKEALIQSNPDAAQRVKDHNENVAGFLTDKIKEIADTLRDTGLNIAKNETKAGRDLQRLEALPGDLIGDQTGRVAGLTTVVNTVINQAGNVVQDARKLAQEDANKNVGSSGTVSNSGARVLPPTGNEKKSEPEPPIFSVRSAGESEDDEPTFSVAGAEETLIVAVAPPPQIDCSHIPGSTAVQGDCICTDGLIHSPSWGRCVACSEYQQAANSAINDENYSAAQAIVNEARECTSWVSRVQGLINSGASSQVCNTISANLRGACQNDNAPAAGGFMAEANQNNCNIDDNLWQWGNSIIAQYNQKIDDQVAAQERAEQAEYEAQTQAQNETSWMDVFSAVVKGVQDAQSEQDRRSGQDRSSGGRSLPTSIPLPTGSMPIIPGVAGVVFPGAGPWNSSSNGGQSAGNIPGNTQSGSGTANTQSSNGMGGSSCELKFCPVCAEGSKGVDLLGLAVNPQCNDCRRKYRKKISDCAKGISSAGSTGNTIVTGPSRPGKPPSDYRCSPIFKGSWKACIDKGRDLNERGNTHYNISTGGDSSAH